MRTLTAVVGIGAVLAVFSAPVRAEVTENVFVPLDGLIMNQECPGVVNEDIEMIGTLHILTVINEKNNIVTFREHFQPQDVFGFGLTTGNQYVGAGMTQTFSKGSLLNGQYIQTFVDNFLLIGKGQATKFRVTWNSHVTYNANGDLTVTYDNHRIECY